MDVLKFLLRLPFTVIKALCWLLSRMFFVLGLLLRPLLGEVRWRAPRWVAPLKTGFARLEQGVDRHPRIIALSVLLLAAAGVAGVYGWHWWQNRPKPIDVAPLAIQQSKAQVVNPAAVDYSVAKPAVQQLTLRFNQSVAPVTLVGKPVTSGISLKPALAGEWQWQNAWTLLFTPQQPLPMGANYEATLEPDVLLAPQIRLEQTRYTFNVPAFDYQIGSSEYYQDPQDRSQQSAIFNITFNAPADVQSVEKQLTLGLSTAQGQPEQPLKFSVTWDEKKLNAWVRSTAIKPMDQGGAVHLQVNSGVKSSRPGNQVTRKSDSWVKVPNLYSLSLSDISAEVVDKPGSQGERALIVGFSDAVRDRDVGSAVKAWLLPAQDPRRPASEQSEDEFTVWDQDNIDQSVIASSPSVPLSLNDAEENWQPQFSFRFDAPAQRYLLVSIDRTMTSAGGYKMPEKQWRVVQVPDYPKLLQFAAQGALLSVNGDKRISVAARNVPGLRVDIKRVIPGQLQHIVSFKSRQFASADFNRLNDEYFTERFRYQTAVNNEKPGEVSYQGIDLSRYLSTRPDSHRGVFLLTLSEWSPKQKETAPAEEEYQEEEGQQEVIGDSRFVVVTDLGIIAKRSQDKTRDLFVQSIASGQPVAGAQVSVVAKNGEKLLTRQTASDGHVSFPSLEVYTNEREPVMFLVEKEGDVSFLPTGRDNDRGLDFSRFDVYGETTPDDTRTLGSYLFSDRGVYRPGDTFHIGLITRAADWSVPVGGIPVRAEIRDPRDKLMRTVPLTLSASGFNELSFTTEESSPTGEWNIYLYLPGKDDDSTRLLGSTAVNVKEFEPDQLKVRLTLTPDRQQGWVKPDALRANIDVQNLFGTPAQGRRVASKMTLRPVYPAFDRYADYAFYEARSASDGYETELEDSTTDDKGAAAIKLDLSGFGESTYQLQLLSEAFVAGGGRSVAATARTLVSPYDYLIGVKADGELGYIHQNAQRNINIIAIDPSLDTIALNGLKLHLLEQKYLSVLTRQESGVYKYQSKLKEIPVSDAALDLPAAGHTLALATDKPGDYVLVVENAKGEVLNRISYSVTGEANLTRSLDRNAELKLKLNSDKYQPGSEIEVAINAPYTGSGLITIEKDRVYSWQWFHTTTTNSVQKIRIPAGLEGNAYINVQFVRDINSDEIFMSPLSYGVMPFKISNDARKNTLKLDVPEVIKPGEDLTINVTTDGPQQVALFAVDEGILQVARYRLTDPLDYFFRKRELNVESSQILDLILPEFSKLMSLTSAPGGDGGEGLDLHLNPFKRKRDKPVAYWSGITEVNGQAQFTYPVPDYFNGKIRVMAISVTPEKIGKAQTETTVRDNFILTPNVPSMVAPGDEFDVSVGVSNNLEGQGEGKLPVAIKVTPPPQLDVVGPAEQSLELAAKHEGVVSFRLRAKAELGDAPLVFSAHYSDKTSRRTISTSVRPAMPFRIQTVMGRMSGKQQQVDNLRQMFGAYAQRQAAVSNSPLVLTSGLASYLANYPYYCSEQIVSQSIPLLLQSEHPELRSGLDADKVRQQLKGILDVLRSRQNGDGAIGLWMASPQADPFVTPYVVQYLLEAKAAGYPLPAGMLDDANVALRTLAASGYDDLYRLRLRAWAVYLLTRQGEITTNALASVQETLKKRYPDSWQTDLSTLYLASSWRLLKADDEAERLMQPGWQALNKAYDKSWWTQNYYDPLVQDATRLYLITRHFPEKVSAIPPQLLENMVMSLREERYTTFSAAMSILALESYSEQVAQQNDPQALTISQLGRENKVPQLISALQGRFAQGSFSADTAAVQFHNAGKSPAWYVVTQAGYDLAAPDKAISRGLEISRDYTDAAGKEIDKVTLGQTINVHLKIRANSKAALSNLAIVDLLPGGFEVVQQTPPPPETDDEQQDASAAGWQSPLAASGSTWAPDFSDIREDRVIIYGSASTELQEFVYQIKATNTGSFVIPPAYGEAMYDREIQAMSASAGKLTVVPAE
ncbi:alpha-2-macroglobulin family protein [Erwinia sorbitola]|uniref:Alpha-2-macroglobulin family protein n=1 Tax=Erwinia sorbitola TaxID=2681984 RepID=A0A6I6EPQ3_9GAMM|nr:alpha-2-macroglobulin [Erwinia sorbitola]QGU86652.1 alpha-2-macroglobulin family protein [Erwinia sorbitola]